MTFEHLIQDQIEYGGRKYAFNGQRESTDILVDKYGIEWLVGTMNKYVFRYQNEGREKDPLKIGAYAYLFWLKTGCHCDAQYTLNGVLFDTNPQNKVQYIQIFLELARERALKVGYKSFDTLHHLLPRLITKKFYEVDIFDIFNCAKDEWDSKFAHSSTHDTDTWNKGK